MITIDASGMPQLLAAMDRFSERRMRNAISTALTRTAKDLKQAEQDAMRSQIDRPREYTINSATIEPATAETLAARMYLKVGQGSGRGAGKYILPQIEGGVGHLRGFELALQGRGLMPKGYRVTPGRGAELDAYGNISKSTLNRIFRALVISGPRKQRKLKKGAQPERIFSVLQRKGKLMPGIYSVNNNKLTKIVGFTQYIQFKKRYDFFGVAMATAVDRFPIRLSEAIAQSTARLDARGK